MVIGMLFILTQQVGLYYISATEDDGDTFLTLSFVFQIIGGFGSGTNSVASMAMVVADAEKNEKEEHIGLIETATGIGYLFGPFFGSLMFHIGGYPAPFGFSGKFFIYLTSN